MKNTYKNHITVCLDRSSSMSAIIEAAKKIFNNQIKSLREKSLSYEQETRISFYTFASDVECVINDVDVARPMELDRITAWGNTSMLDCVGLAIEDLKEIPQKYGDHAFCVYVITDGEENNSRKYSPDTFRALVSSLPDNFTVAAFVPTVRAVDTTARYGIPRGCIQQWNTTQDGIEEVGRQFNATVDNFLIGRTTGKRSSKTIFSDLSEVTSKNVTKVLQKMGQHEIVTNKGKVAVAIKPFVEKAVNCKYVQGCAFYELIKTETIQPQKEIAIENKKDGKVYTGANARKLIHLPDTKVDMSPVNYKDWTIFVQSTSVNRKVMPNQRILVVT